MTNTPCWADLQEWVRGSDQILVKRLSRNDCSWADDRGNHQNGFYVPASVRNASFFPARSALNPAKPHIFTAFFMSQWIATGEVKRSAIKHYSNKGPETHVTGVPREPFSGLTPASLLVAGRLKEADDDVSFWFAILDSESSECETLESILDLKVDFECAIFPSSAFFAVAQDGYALLVAELEVAIRDNQLAAFIAGAAKMPSPEDFATRAQNEFLARSNPSTLDPYRLAAPGDALMEISRDIEFAIYRWFELKHRSAQVINTLDIPTKKDGLVSAVVRTFSVLDQVFLSAGQTRKSRGGRSFEVHIGRFLKEGNVPYQAQIVSCGRRPDFVLPSLSALKSGAVVLSAKTTLRERWKQVRLENKTSALFLATVDDRISEQSILEMAKDDITLVVPERLKSSLDTCYNQHENILSFREFFDDIRIESLRPKP